MAMQSRSPDASPKTLAVLSFGLAVIGAFMVAHGIGVISAAWLHPNPNTPPWVFAAIGSTLLLASVLVVAQVKPIPSLIFNMASWGTVAICWLLAHWLLLFAKGASCGIDFIDFGFLGPNVICVGIGGAVLGFFDLVFIATAGKYLWQRRN